MFEDYILDVYLIFILSMIVYILTIVDLI